MIASLFGALALALSACPHGICVVDGDTVKVAGERVRLVGIDAPEVGYYGGKHRPPPCEIDKGLDSADALRAAIATADHVELLFKMEGDELALDHYDRPLAWVIADGLNLNALMVVTGHARVYVPRNKGGWC